MSSLASLVVLQRGWGSPSGGRELLSGWVASPGVARPLGLVRRIFSSSPEVAGAPNCSDSQGTQQLLLARREDGGEAFRCEHVSVFNRFRSIRSLFVVVNIFRSSGEIWMESRE